MSLPAIELPMVGRAEVSDRVLTLLVFGSLFFALGQPFGPASILVSLMMISAAVYCLPVIRYGHLSPRHWTSSHPIDFPNEHHIDGIREWCRANCAGRWRPALLLHPSDGDITSSRRRIVYFSRDDDAALFRLHFG